MTSVSPVGAPVVPTTIPPIDTTAIQNQVKGIAQAIFDQLKDGFQITDLAPLFTQAVALIPVAASLKGIPKDEQWKTIAQCIWNVIGVSAEGIKGKFPNAYNDIIAILNLMKAGTSAVDAMSGAFGTDAAGIKCCTCAVL